MKARTLMAISLLASGFCNPGDVVQLGEVSAEKTWVYLCGLAETVNVEQEVENRQLLDQLGKKHHIRFLAIHPFERCEKANNKLCWIHYTDEQTLETYENIEEVVGKEKIAGFIGFSNGGFFLNKLAQMKELEVPLVSIGASSSFNPAPSSNEITLIVGREEFVYESAQQFAQQAKGSPLSITFIEHEGGHILPAKVLENFIW